MTKETWFRHPGVFALLIKSNTGALQLFHVEIVCYC